MPPCTICPKKPDGSTDWNAHNVQCANTGERAYPDFNTLAQTVKATRNGLITLYDLR